MGSSLTRPQLLGLLAPARCVSEGVASAGLGQRLATQRRNALQWRQRWAEFRAAPASAFSFVVSMGLLYGVKLLADSLPSSAAPRALGRRFAPRVLLAGHGSQSASNPHAPGLDCGGRRQSACPAN